MAVIAPGLSRRRMYGSGSMAKQNVHPLALLLPSVPSILTPVAVCIAIFHPLAPFAMCKYRVKFRHGYVIRRVCAGA